MVVLKFPKTFCNKLNSLMSNFWWGCREAERRIHWVSWKQLSNIKGKGSIGFRDFHLFNLVCLGKQCWRLINNPSSLWAKLFKGLDFSHLDFWNVRNSKRGSWIWNSLLAEWNVLKDVFRINVGDGKSIMIWIDSWVPQLSNFRVTKEQQISHNALLLLLGTRCGK